MLLCADRLFCAATPTNGPRAERDLHCFERQCIDRPRMTAKLKYKGNRLVSLFSGCGGFDLGFQAEGFTPVAAFDSDRTAVSHYRDNVSDVIEMSDLRAPPPSLFANKSIDVLIAGPPCQGFSTAGKGDPKDERNSLLSAAAEIGVEINPRLIVFENVPQVLSSLHLKRWEAVEKRLRENGYRTHSTCCSGSQLGMAQGRRRVFLFAWRTRREIEFDWPNRPFGRLDHTLAGVEAQLNHLPKPFPAGSRLRKISERIGPGQKLSNVRGGPRSVHTWHIPEVFGETTAAECEILEAVMRLRRLNRERDVGEGDPVSMSRLIEEIGLFPKTRIDTLIRRDYLRRVGKKVDLVHTYNGKFRRFRWEDIAATVDTRFGDPNLFLHPNEHRPFTVREAARIQGFPDSFVFKGAAGDSFRIIGNAVPPPMAQTVAEFSRALLGT